MNIYPVPGRTVRDPANGREITGETPVNENDPFWIRRLADGDVTDQQPKAGKTAAGGEQ